MNDDHHQTYIDESPFSVFEESALIDALGRISSSDDGSQHVA